MRAAQAKENRHAYVQAWSLIVEAMADVNRMAAHIAADSKADLKALPEKQFAVRKRLDELEEALSQAQGKAEAHRLLVPLVLHTDELFLNRIPERNHQSWPLLQVDLFGLNNGGEQFFALIDQELRKAQGTPMLLEVFSYCLGHGFVGAMRYKDPDGRDRIKDGDLLDYKQRLIEHLHLAPRTERSTAQGRLSDRKLRSAAEPASSSPGAFMPMVAPVVLYLGTLAILLLLPFVFIFLSNVELKPESQSEPQAAALPVGTFELLPTSQELPPSPLAPAGISSPTTSDVWQMEPQLERQLRKGVR